jgi:hypothetical protein
MSIFKGMQLDQMVAAMRKMSAKGRKGVLSAQRSLGASTRRSLLSRSVGGSSARVFRGNQYVKVASVGRGRTRARRGASRHK